ncbi:hypothetical protein CC1G_05657 [Coprinopsis cinerea okayama7|uniref:Uncharacterized protein n=1 Tax=Coprinopsis cinerea (strain Okayama-7 / 130 / ATCC MYA-4618 / FGSC 9003) TaxID=240176 RepID=A8P1T9_COPC7|nr:hypothetical protein CC1G_05657 [Coprinopsis cinerea okayama7\|eukprot:XP_001838176.1 hypothetical protein CC1G_05657 [Coprinopsis cinerea okayama7\
MHLFRPIVVLFLFLASLVLSAPLPHPQNGTGLSIYPRNTDPSKFTGPLRAIADQINKLVHPLPGTSVLWSGRIGNEKPMEGARTYALANGKTTLEMFLETKGINMPDWRVEKDIWKYASRVFAQRSEGQVVAILGDKHTLRDDSVYMTIERPLVLEKDGTGLVEIRPGQPPEVIKKLEVKNKGSSSKPGTNARKSSSDSGKGKKTVALPRNVAKRK